MKNYSLLIFFFLLFCLTPFKSLAVNLDVVINEIAWMGTIVSVNDEWIELKNNTEQNINLDGWQLIAQDGTPKITLSGTIPANGFYLLERTDDTTVPDVAADLIYKGALSNDGEDLGLYDNLNNLIDEANCSSGWMAGDNKTKRTMERIDPSVSGNERPNWQNSEIADGTPKSQNSIILTKISEPTEPTEVTQKTEEKPVEAGPPLTYPNGIVFNEILPSPEGADDQNEWIEIFNQNNFEVDLTGWKIQDTEGKVTIYSIPANTKIKAKNYLVLPRLLTKITLNNTSDGLKLSQPNNKVIESVTFQKAPTGQSYNRTDSGWMWSNTLTSSAANIIFSAQTITKTGPKQNQENLTNKTNYSAGLAGIYSSLSQNLPRVKDPWFLFLIAITITIVSGLIVIFIKHKTKRS